MPDQKYACLSTTLLLWGLLSAFTPASQGAIIDDFSTPQGPLTGVADVVSGPGIAGGFREASDPFFSVSGGVARFSFSFDVPGTNVMGIAYDGTPEPSDGGVFSPLLDLTDGGAASHFLLGISEITSALSMVIGVTDADANNLGAIFGPIVLPGLYSLPIAAGPADLTRVSRVDVVLFLSVMQPSRSASVGIDFMCTGTLEAGCTGVDPVTAVPEPGTAVLLALGAALLALFAYARPGAGDRIHPRR